MKTEQPPKREVTSDKPIVEKFTGEALEQRLTRLEIRVRLKRKRFFHVILAGDEETGEKAVEDIREKLGIDERAVIKTTFPLDGRDDLTSTLLELSDQIRTLPGDRVMIVVDGIEVRAAQLLREHPNQVGPSPAHRLLHDYAQQIFDSSDVELLERTFEGDGKKIILLTRIGKAAGEKAYADVLADAVQTRFKEDIYQV